MTKVPPPDSMEKLIKELGKYSLDIQVEMLPAMAETLGMDITDSDTFMRYGANIVKLLKPLIVTMLATARKQEREELIEKYGDFKDQQKRTVRFYALPHTEHKPGDDGSQG